MRGKTTARFAVALLMFSGSLAHAATSSSKTPHASTPDVRSDVVLILDQQNHVPIYARKADVAAPIASITKLMTALVVLEAGQQLDEPIVITEEDRTKGKGAYSRLAPGAKLTRGDLLHLALMSSENRAAHAVGRNYPGGLQACVRAMNAKAKALRMSSAHFVDPAGLSSQNVASATDLAKLVMATAQNPLIREYSTDDAHTVQVGKHLLEFRNTNSLVSNPTWNIVVQKTGYIAEAGRCLVLDTIIQERQVVIVLLNSFGKYTRTADAKRIRSWMESTHATGGSSLGLAAD